MSDDLAGLLNVEVSEEESQFLPYDAEKVRNGFVNMSKKCKKRVLNLPEYPEVDFDSMGYTPEQILWIKYGLAEGASVFAKNKEDLGLMADTEHQIDVEGHPPIAQPMRPIPLAKKNVIVEEVAKMLKAGVIRPSKSPWSSPIV